jgi:hypothetical protein
MYSKLLYRDHTHISGGKKTFYLQANANWVKLSITEQIIKISASLASVLPSVANKYLRAS